MGYLEMRKGEVEICNENNDFSKKNASLKMFTLFMEWEIVFNYIGSGKYVDFPKTDSEKYLTEKSLFCKNTFDRLLLKTDFEKDTDNLFNLGIKSIMVWKDSKNSKNTTKQINDYLIELTKAILFLMENKNVKIKLQSKLVQSFFNMENQISIDLIKECLLSEFKKRGLNEIPMSYETGERILKSGNENVWIQEYYDDMADNMDLYDDERCYHIDIEDEMINEFITDRKEQTEDISIEFVKSKLKELEKAKERGAPEKNVVIAYLLWKILPKERKPTNNDFRFIYDYCNFFNLIPDKITSEPHQYIKSIYQNYKREIDTIFRKY